jgi:hypothetical protein
MDAPQLEWSAAEVRDGSLSVSVSGDVDKDWANTFTRTLALLSSDSDWGPAAFKRKSGAVTIEHVPEGSEDKIRFALDAAVQEANAHHTDEDPDDSEESDPESDDDEGDDADARMTDRFRG